MATDFELEGHKKWQGFLQPVGLVASPIALNEAQVTIPRQVSDLQERLESLVRQDVVSGAPDDGAARLDDFAAFATRVLEWERTDLVDAQALPESLSVPLPEYGEVLAPTHAVPDPDKAGAWLMLVQVVPAGTDLDDAGPAPTRAQAGWHASPQAKLERLLRAVEVPIGLLCNGTHVRLVYAPRGETSGHLTFPVQAMTEVAGRLILGAMHQLLSAERLFTVRKDRRLPALLEASRKYQNEVSTRLAEQVMAALNDLLRGFQAADASAQGALLGTLPQDDPQHVYGGLLTTLMRLVFLLYAEDRGLMPSDPVYGQHYSVAGLFDKLREDAGRYPDTMDRRYGAWARLLSLFRLVYDGGNHAGIHLPPRHGRLFDPDAYPFLEGRPFGVARVIGDRLEPPRVSDGVVHRVLTNLLVLDAERLSYRTLDVEQIGSVYEAMMGYDLTVASGPSIAVRPDHVMVDLQDLLDRAPGERAKHLKERAGCDVTGAALAALREAKTPDDVVAAMGRKTSPRTPTMLAPGSLYLQPGEERRRSGSHYTPRSLTEPIVRTTLRPILKALGPRPTPQQILDLKVCDPAMGSGAFLVETCRQLADELLKAWDLHGGPPADLPPDEEPLLHARRLVAQRCLYGVDKNPFAVDLAKLSLWLVTLARDHAFTFLDHALRHGDSLVGLTRAQIVAFDWKVDGTTPRQLDWLDGQIEAALANRIGLQDLKEDDYAGRHSRWLESEDALADARLVGDLCVAAFFAADKDRAREEKRREYFEKVRAWRDGNFKHLAIQGICDEPRDVHPPNVPFHWEIEFPEVFARENQGFDAVVGNPPFLGGRKISPAFGDAYISWLLLAHAQSHGNADLVAHFFRRSFHLIRDLGTSGLVATNTIGQGDTRSSGLRWICSHGGVIYHALRRMKWSGKAAVTVSVVWLVKGRPQDPRVLDGKSVPEITAFLFHAGGHEDPVRLKSNAAWCYQGNVILGLGFLFDDATSACTPLSVMRDLVSRNPRNRERIFPCIGGDEVNSSPTHSCRRYVIDFGELSEEEARQWPDLMDILEKRVKAEREASKRDAYRQRWWLFAERQPALKRAIAGLDRVLVHSQVSSHVAFALLPNDRVFSHALNVFALPRFSTFCTLQARVHEVWARFFGSSLEDRLRYAPSDCFETFPSPPNWESDPHLEEVGQQYYDFRAALMIRNNEGLTKTYNRFHDPAHDGTGVDGRSPADVIADIQRLRELHEAMDRAVLDVYGWTDIPTRCAFLLDYEEDQAGDEDDGKRHRKKPWRLRWPDDVRDEVLARLLVLNAKRAEEERLAGASAASAQEGRQATPRRKRSGPKGPDLFGGS